MSPWSYKSISVSLAISITLVLQFSCKDPFQYNPNEVLLPDDHKNLNQKSISAIEAQPLKDTLNFIVIADPHHDYENLEDFVGKVNSMPDISFVLVAGDLTSFGLQTEFITFCDILHEVKVPCVAVIGNHDILAKGEFVYKEMFGPTDFSFHCNGNKFVCLNSNSREYNFNGLVPDVGWLNQQLANAYEFNNIFVISHIAPFDADFDSNLEQGYKDALGQTENVRMSLHGHSHDYYYADHYYDGVMYLITDDIKDRSFSLIKAWDQSFTTEKISY